MEKFINLKVVTIDGLVYYNKVKQVTIPAKKGQLTILPSHMPMLIAVRKGIMTIVEGYDCERTFIVHNGFVEIKKDLIDIAVDYFREIK